VDIYMLAFIGLATIATELLHRRFAYLLFRAVLWVITVLTFGAAPTP